MVIKIKQYVWTGVLAAVFAATLSAAPKLRLASTSLNQVAIAAGSNAATQTVDVMNVGDGSLNLKVSSTAAWLVPTLGAAHSCSSGTGGACIPIQIVFQTASLTAGTYAGLVTVSDSNAIDSPQTINVSVQLGSGVPDKLDFSVTPGASASAMINTASIVTLKPVVDSGSWLSALQSGGTPFSPSIPYTATASAGAMAVGDYHGTLAVTGSVTSAENKNIAVTLHVVAQSLTGPIATVGGALNNTTYAAGESLAQGDIVALFGMQFITGGPTAPTMLPLPTSFGMVQVLLNGQPVPLYYVSAGQINLQIPYDAQVGVGTLQVVSGGVNGNIISVTVAKAVPRILRLNGVYDDYGIIVNASDNTLALPVSSGVGGHPVKIGDALTIYAIGFGATNPAVAGGVASPAMPLAIVTNNPKVCFQHPTPFNPGLCVAPLFAGLSPNFVGLYQINVVVPAASPTGDAVPVYISTDSGDTNEVTIAIQK